MWLTCESYKFDFLSWADAGATKRFHVAVSAPNDANRYFCDKPNSSVAKQMLDIIAKGWPNRSFQFTAAANYEITAVREPQ